VPKGEWTQCTDHPSFYGLHKYRRKPKTISINGFDVPMPITVKPKPGQIYYVSSIVNINFFDKHIWADDKNDNTWLSLKICHLDADSAIIHAKALLSFTGK
jgi:hypothetical protein